MSSATTLKRTPFFEQHRAAGAKLVDFAGYEMPLRYRGDVEEHRRVRTGVGLFDVSHMGEFRVTGAGAVGFLDRAVTNDVAALEVGQALYTPICRPDGGIVDDALIYRAADHHMVVVNASNIAKDFAWLAEQCPADATLTDVSEDLALLALQGPRAAEVLRDHVPAAALVLGYYRFMIGPVFGVDAVISRTGYTGEDGFELYFHPRHAATIWEQLFSAGAPHGLEPIGLGARDTLRLEMAYMLYGNDIDDSTSPLAAGLGWTVKLGKSDFAGREVLVRQKQEGAARRLVGLEAEGRRVPRHGMAIERDGRAVGTVTSGAFGPSLERAIAMAYVDSASAALGTALEVVAGSTRIPVRTVKRPFYTQGTHR
ncbi:MAG: glycine cleavage system aminomethyltransferase GcvT [Candidatus Eisenbacteria bacterium]|uniref:Aminomethyltransferase n=1 Tax=Eiseniibacteriota bacterium TaxID=2212470 RepID=A0A849SQT5_UNCEI|nr:glycine cleavage system aminomethyltransferase GcvT [Candidatus Eisenbacteria bacterium]